MRMGVRAWLDRWGDWLLAAVLAISSQYEIWVRPLPADQSVTTGRPAAAGLFLLVTLPLAWRRRYPVAVLFVVIAAAVCAAFVIRPSQGPVASWIAGLVAFYSVAANCAERRALLAGGIGLALLAIFIITGHPGTLSPGSLAILAVAWLVGWYLRQRRSQVSGLQDRAARAEHEREEQARAAVSSERGRIARELHDIVAHSVSVMVIQAQAGQRLIGDAAQARAAFGSIEASGREALVELRRLLAILRTADDQTAVGPQPGLGSLDSLIGQVREAGLPVQVRIEGQQVPLPPGVDLSAYRIIQEALTNTIKHAGPATAEVVLRYDTAALQLEITDTGAAAAPGTDTAPRRRRARDRSRADRHARADHPARRQPGSRSPRRRRLSGPRPAAADRGERDPAVTIRVLIADDQELVRTGFRVIVNAEPDLQVVGEARDGNEVIQAARTLRPQVVLMDIRMPNLDGIAATRQVTVGDGSPRVLILTTFDLDEYVYDALRAGASGFLLKDAAADDLLQAIRVIAAGEALLAPSITRRLIEDYTRRPAPRRQPDALASLTARELDVMRLLARGMSNTGIARDLFLGDATVKTHIARIFTKLNLHDRAQAVVLAYETGLVQPGDREIPRP